MKADFPKLPDENEGLPAEHKQFHQLCVVINERQRYTGNSGVEVLFKHSAIQSTESHERAFLSPP